MALFIIYALAPKSFQVFCGQAVLGKIVQAYAWIYGDCPKKEKLETWTDHTTEKVFFQPLAKVFFLHTHTPLKILKK
jgi:hypothetical protein